MDKEPLCFLFRGFRLVWFKGTDIELGSIDDLPVRSREELESEFKQWVEALIILDVRYVVLLDGDRL